jgi:glutamate racemase
MKIGVFDSGLGGLIIMRSIIKLLPQYEYVYFGDTKHVPYGNRSEEAIYRYTESAIDFLFKQGCALIIIACNTASTEALRRIQQEYLLKRYPDRRVLGVIIPTAEECIDVRSKRIGLLATIATVRSVAYIRELKKLDPGITIFQKPAPLLAPMIENDGLKWLKPIVQDYLRTLLARRVDTILLACTHYPLIKTMIRQIVGKKIRVISQDELLPKKLKDYLKRHPEIEKTLAKNKKRTFYATDVTPTLKALAQKWFGKKTSLHRIALP